MCWCILRTGRSFVLLVALSSFSNCFSSVFRHGTWKVVVSWHCWSGERNVFRCFSCCSNSVLSPWQSSQHNSHHTWLDSTTISFCDHRIHSLILSLSSHLWTKVRTGNWAFQWIEHGQTNGICVPKNLIWWQKIVWKWVGFQHFSKTNNISCSSLYIRYCVVWRCQAF